MKRIAALPVLVLAVLLSSCLKDKFTRTYTVYKPILQTKQEVRNGISSGAARQVEAPGKIFVYGNFIFLNEIDKGVHIIDNTNPAAPRQQAFIPIPGNLDIAVKGTTLYCDFYDELLAIDISNPLQAKLTTAIPHVFPERLYYNQVDSNYVVTGWEQYDTTITFSGGGCKDGQILAAFNGQVMTMTGGGPSGLSAPAGIAGSMARFALVNDWLYTVNYRELFAFDISNPMHPQQRSRMDAGWLIETIYPFGDRLFLGAQSGMYMFDITHPSTPVARGQFIHARACDPVVADHNFAYVTLRNGSVCMGAENELNIVDVTDLSAPRLVNRVLLTNPHGLAKDGNHLFICDGDGGLKYFNAQDPVVPVLRHTITAMHPTDAIAWNGNLLVTAREGIFQYRYDGTGNLQQISRIMTRK